MGIVLFLIPLQVYLLLIHAEQRTHKVQQTLFLPNKLTRFAN